MFVVTSELAALIVAFRLCLLILTVNHVGGGMVRFHATMGLRSLSSQ
jgi:hypothetical protein